MYPVIKAIVHDANRCCKQKFDSIGDIFEAKLEAQIVTAPNEIVVFHADHNLPRGASAARALADGPADPET
jgi:hypothetical protein